MMPIFPLIAVIKLIIVFVSMCVYFMIFWRVYLCLFLYLLARHLMLLMGSNSNELILQVHWGSCLIMVIFLQRAFHSIIFHYVYNFMLLMKIFSTTLQGVMHLLVQYVSFSFGYSFQIIKRKSSIRTGFQLEALAFGSTAMCGRATFWWWLISAVTFFGATWE
jgi:hypothetical protein